MIARRGTTTRRGPRGSGAPWNAWIARRGQSGGRGAGALPIAAALHVPSDGVIDVGALLATFARDLAIVCGVRVALVEPSARGVRLVKARGALEVLLLGDAAGARGKGK